MLKIKCFANFLRMLLEVRPSLNPFTFSLFLVILNRALRCTNHIVLSAWRIFWQIQIGYLKLRWLSLHNKVLNFWNDKMQELMLLQILSYLTYMYKFIRIQTWIFKGYFPKFLDESRQGYKKTNCSFNSWMTQWFIQYLIRCE